MRSSSSELFYKTIIIFLASTIFFVSLGIGIYSLRVGQSEIRGALAEDPLWSAASLEAEYWRFRTALADYSADSGLVAQDDLQTRLDILWSRINIYTDNSYAWQYLNEAEPAKATLSALRSVLAEYDDRLVELKPGDQQFYRELGSRLDKLNGRVRDFVVTTNLDLITYRKNLRNNWIKDFDSIMLVMFSAILGGMVLSYLLFRQSVRSQRLARQAAGAEESMRVAKEAAETADRAKSEFLARMSHEFRTPLHGILSFSKLGVKRHKTLTPEKAERYFENINICGSRMLLLVNDLLDISKLSAGKMSLDLTHSDIKDIWRLATQEMHSLLEEKGIQLDFRATTANTVCRCDRNRILQVVSNIVSNAIKFSPKNSVIRCEVGSTLLRYDDAAAEEGISVAITDQGCGIDDAAIGSVFEKFVQLKNSRQAVSGTGLGLAICKEIIQLHRGRIHADNLPDGGARFVFSMPLDQPGREGTGAVSG